jgi:hypothetical protein
MKSIIHVNAQLIKRNIKNKTTHPVVRVQQGSKQRYCSEAIIDGPSRIVYSPERPLSCGARLWIETEADVTLVDETTYAKMREIMNDKN